MSEQTMREILEELAGKTGDRRIWKAILMGCACAHPHTHVDDQDEALDRAEMIANKIIQRVFRA